MGKLTGAKKAAFLERMAKGRKKAKRTSNPMPRKIKYDDGVHMVQYFIRDSDGWHLIGYDGVQRDVPKKGPIRDAFKRLTRKKKNANPNARRTKKAIGKAMKKAAAKKRQNSIKQLKKRFKTESGAQRFAEKVGGHWVWNGASGRQAVWYVYYTGEPRKRGRNPDDMAAAERKYEEFHGRPATRTIDYETSYRYPEHFAEMGKLVELKFHLDKLNPEFSLVKFKGTQAVCTPDGLNIYFIGGDQSVDFDAINIASDKDFVELGPCKYICYDTVKGFHDFQQTDYWHLFGEEDGVFPVLVYDRLNKSLFLVGGNYRVRPEGIVN